MTEPQNSDQTTPPPVSQWIPPDTKPAAIRPPRSAKLRSWLAIAGFLLTGFFGFLAGVQDLLGLDVFARAFDGTLTLEEGNAFDSTMATMGTLQLVAIVIWFITFLAWQSRSVDNVPGLGGGSPVVTPGWSIAWWFVPIANIIQPYRILSDLYRRMGPAGVGAAIVLVWWLLWIVTNVISLVASSAYGTAQDLASYQAGLTLWALSDFGDAVVAVIGILMVLRIQGWADARQSGQMTSSDAEPEPVPTPAS